MMHTRQAVCMKCDHTFTIHKETSGSAHLLHCVRCGRDKLIGAADLKEVYSRSLATLLIPPTFGIKCLAEPVTPLFSSEPIDCRKYTRMVEQLAGLCICGSVFRFSGKPRCPICRSAVIRTVQAGKPFAVQAAQAVHA
ncbi:MAG: hypothetical protein Q8R70_11910 [Methanoregula sp.]|nr:hypothetical protein [Methanoregula sp.]